MAGAVGTAPVLGLAVAAPAAAAAPAAHASGKEVSLEAGQGATACTGPFSKIARAYSSDLVLSVPHKGSCVVFTSAFLRLSESPGSYSEDIMRVRVYDGGAQVYSRRAVFYDDSGSVQAVTSPNVIGQRVCVAAFSRLHPRKKIAGPLCVKV
ncbi:MAG TPA: hypothetical protein VGH27_27145 [Streptosporangiaceae bacterium]|jgi:hypothetical protein